MDESLREYLGNFKECFSSSDNLRYLELWNFQDSRRNVCRDRPIDGISPAAWLLPQEEYNQYDEAIEGLRIIFSEGDAKCWDKDPSGLRASHPPLRMRENTFVSIVQAFSLPLSYLRMLKEGSTVFIDVQDVHRKANGNIQNFMIQNCFTSTSQFSVALTYEPQRRLTSALIHSLSENEISNLVKQISEHKDCIALPMLLTSLLLASRVASANTKVRECHQQIAEIEHMTGIRTNWHPNEPCCSVHQRQLPGRNRYDALDFDLVTGDLTSLKSKLAYCEYLCEVHLPMLDDFDRINNKLLEWAPSEHKGRLEKAEARLCEDINFLRSSLRGTLYRAQYLSKRCKAQVQTIYSLIAQKDNALSMRDNATLRAISEDQKGIALAATRDSAAMRVISAITTVFLPATFTSTLFSTTFFNFQAGRNGNVISWWLWLYVLVTAILSAIILLWWYVTSRRKIHKVDDVFGRGDEKLSSEPVLVQEIEDGGNIRSTIQL